MGLGLIPAAGCRAGLARSSYSLLLPCNPLAWKTSGRGANSGSIGGMPAMPYTTALGGALTSASLWLRVVISSSYSLRRYYTATFVSANLH